ncbi:MAG TPA: hypothetical protein VFZ59_12935 [Verrucomicrobiae bacterium]|nr:hypothetical protein [Verrucomicrobiae bacterium]
MSRIMFLAKRFAARPVRVAKNDSKVRPHPGPLPQGRENGAATKVGFAHPSLIAAQIAKRNCVGATQILCELPERVYRYSLAPIGGEGQGEGARGARSFPHQTWFVAAIAGLLALTPPTYASNAAANTNRAAAPAVVAAHPQSSTALAVEDIRDIRPPFHVPPGWLWAAWVAGGCSALALAYALWRWRHRIPGLRPKLPYELALEKLEAARELMQPATAREFSIAVSVVVRNYIEERFATYAAHRTTDEFLRDCATRSDSPLTAYREPLSGFLTHCDLAKFARWILSGDEMEAMLQSACTFVRETGRAAATKQSPAHSSCACSTPHQGDAERTNAPESTSAALNPS